MRINFKLQTSDFVDLAVITAWGGVGGGGGRLKMKIEVICPGIFQWSSPHGGLQSGLSYLDYGKRNYFTGNGILLHKLPVVVVLITQSNNNEGTMKNSILITYSSSSHGIAKFACREVRN